MIEETRFKTYLQDTYRAVSQSHKISTFQIDCIFPKCLVYMVPLASRLLGNDTHEFMGFNKDLYLFHSGFSIEQLVPLYFSVYGWSRSFIIGKTNIINDSFGVC